MRNELLNIFTTLSRLQSYNLFCQLIVYIQNLFIFLNYINFAIVVGECSLKTSENRMK